MLFPLIYSNAPKRGVVTPPDSGSGSGGESFSEFYDDFERVSLGPNWVAVAGSISLDGSNLIVPGDTGIVELVPTWNEPFEIYYRVYKNSRYTRLLLPNNYMLHFGGWHVDPPSGEKYGVNLSLRDLAGGGFTSGATVLQECFASEFITAGDFDLRIQVLADKIKVYCQQVSTGRYLHNDTLFRINTPGPAISYDLGAPPDYDGQEIQLHGKYPSQSHTFRDFGVRAPLAALDGEEFIQPPSAVPTLASDGLTIPTIKYTPSSHIGLMMRVDSTAIDDTDVIDKYSGSHWGSPGGASTTQIKAVEPDIDVSIYKLITIWGSVGEYNSWATWCSEQDPVVDPLVGKLGPFVGEPGGPPEGFAGGAEVGYKNLESQDMQDWLTETTTDTVALMTNDAVFYDVDGITANPSQAYAGTEYDPEYSNVQWQDLVGSTARRLWRDVIDPAGKYVAHNVGNADWDSDLRLFQWIPAINYLDRYILNRETNWDWFEKHAIRNPINRQAQLSEGWISIIDSLGTDANCLNDDIKMGWLTFYYIYISNTGGFGDKHFLAGGYNGDTKGDGTSGRSEVAARHYIPCSQYNIGSVVTPCTAYYAEDPIMISGVNYTRRIYRAAYSSGNYVYHYPLPKTAVGFGVPSYGSVPNYTLQWPTDSYIITYYDFDGTPKDPAVVGSNYEVTIPPGSGRIVNEQIIL